MEPMKIPQSFSRILGVPAWRDSEYICAVADEDRHLGHAVQTEKWHAYDATKLNAESNGFKYLGEFDTAVEAKEAVERSFAQSSRADQRRAGGHE
jgi:hypothetical protein